MGLFPKRLEVRLTNVAGFPTDVPVGLVLRTSDGKRWRVIKRASDTVLVLAPLHWWHNRFVRLGAVILAGIGLGLVELWWLR